MKKIWCVLVLIFFSSLFCIASQNHSDTLFEQLYLLQFNPQKELLQNSPSPQFPYNILLNFKGNTDKTLYIILSQKNALENFNILTPFLLSLQTQQHQCNTVIVFTTNNESQLPEPIGYTDQGIQTFFSKIPDTDKSAALVIDIPLDEKGQTTLTLGGNEKITPPWLVSLVTKAFNTQQESFSIQDSSLSLYRMGLMESNSLLGYLLQKDLPALGISANKQHISTVLSCIETIVQNFNTTEIGNWDSQYSIVSLPFFNKTFFVSEKTYIIGILIFAAAALAFLFLFSFFIGKNAQRRKRDFSRTWFLLPLLLFVNILLFYLAQKWVTLCFPLFAQRPLLTLLFKCLYFIIFTALLSFVQYLINLPFSFYIYGFLQTIASFFIIIFFGILDLSLIPYCMLFYIIVYFSRMMKKLIPLILVFFLMFVPFVPVLQTIIQYGSKELLRQLVQSPFHINALFAVLFIPFQFMWLRILQRLQLFGKQNIFVKKRFILELLAILIIFAFLSSNLLAINSLLKKESATQGENSKEIQLSSSTRLLNISEQVVPSFNSNYFECKIASPDQVIRFDITIKGNKALPLYDANFPFNTFEKENTAIFYLDENPPNPLIVQFTTAPKEKITLLVTAYIKRPQNHIEKITVERNLGNEIESK